MTSSKKGQSPPEEEPAALPQSAERKSVPRIEPILLATACVQTFDGNRPLTNASGFFFARGERLFRVTSRHVLLDAPSRHIPDRIEIQLHIEPDNLAQSTGFSMPLYRKGKHVWRRRSSSFGQRLKGEGHFLADARTYRGTRGAPVVMRLDDPGAAAGRVAVDAARHPLARQDVGGRDLTVDEALGLNMAWYADILLTLTED